MSKTDTEDSKADTEEQEDGGKKKLAGKTIVLFIVAPLLLLAGLGAGGYFFFLAGGEDNKEDTQAQTQSADPVFVEIPEMMVNLSDGGQNQRYIKMKVSIEVFNQQDVAALEKVMPRIIDGFQVYLREMRPQDFEGSGGMFMLKEELIRRLNLVAGPSQVKDILFNEIIIQ